MAKYHCGIDPLRANCFNRNERNIAGCNGNECNISYFYDGLLSKQTNVRYQNHSHIHDTSRTFELNQNPKFYHLLFIFSDLR